MSKRISKIIADDGTLTTDQALMLAKWPKEIAAIKKEYGIK